MDALQGVIRQNAEKKNHKSLSFIITSSTFQLLSFNRITTVEQLHTDCEGF